MNPVDLMAQLIRENAPPDIWANSPLAAYRQLGMTNRGEIGEQFIEQYLNHFGIEARNGNRADETDRRIGTMLLEIKTAGLGANGTFQFNHVRLDRNYHHLICLGVCPNQLVFNMWPEDVVRANGAGQASRYGPRPVGNLQVDETLRRYATYRRLGGTGSSSGRRPRRLRPA